MFEGVSVALATPFSGGALDEAAYSRLIDHVFDQGVAGIVATGSTGETPTLDLGERIRIWELAVGGASGRGFVIAGTGTNATRESIELSKRAAETGVDGCMTVAPYYNKPQQRGIAAHFLAVADASPVPLVLYNVPSRTGVNLLPATVASVAGHERIVAIKEASGSLDQVTEILGSTDLTVLSGDDSLTLPVMAAGGGGVVSVAGHLAGREMVEMVGHLAAGRIAEAGAIHRRLLPLVKALFRETNPAPLKAGLAHLGLIENEVRSPLATAEPETVKRVVEALESLRAAAGGVGKR